MEQFDPDYFDERKEQIKELFELRAMTIACGVTGMLLVLVGVIIVVVGSDIVGGLVLAFAAAFIMGALFMLADYLGKRAANRAVRREYERLIMLNPALAKAKRGGRDDEDDDLLAADDGELPDAIGLDEQIRARARAGTRLTKYSTLRLPQSHGLTSFVMMQQLL